MTTTNNIDENEEQTPTGDEVEDKKLLVRMHGIMLNSITWWEKCADEQSSRGIGGAMSSVEGAIRVIEKLEARLNPEQRQGTYEWVIGFKKVEQQGEENE